MLGPIRPEAIYDAMVDDEAFGRLASDVAETIGARSGVIHWRDPQSETVEISYSGYFAEEHMAVYEREFADCDVWAAATAKLDCANRVWNCDALVSPESYESSRIYNEWIRPMGDDTFRCVGAVLRFDGGIGEMGFHRGKGQSAFDDETIRALEASLDHLRRMIVMRSRLAAAERLRASAATTLNAIGHAVFTLHPKGHLLHCNEAGETLLQRGDGLTLRDRRLVARLPADQASLQAAIDRALSPSAAQAGGLFINRVEGRPYELTLASVGVGAAGRQVVIIATDPEARDGTLPGRLAALYGLTAAEAEVAVRLSQGASLDRLAEERRVAISTVRSQLKSIAAKLGCGRQSEMVALINNLPRLHNLG